MTIGDESTKFFGWKDYDQCIKDWELKDHSVFPKEDQIIFASYGFYYYEGDAIVVFEKDGKLFENVGGHCSCYGLEGQWRPEWTSWPALAMRKLDQDGHGPIACLRFYELVKQNT